MFNEKPMMIEEGAQGAKGGENLPPKGKGKGARKKAWRTRKGGKGQKGSQKGKETKPATLVPRRSPTPRRTDGSRSPSRVSM